MFSLLVQTVSINTKDYPFFLLINKWNPKLTSHTPLIVAHDKNQNDQLKYRASRELQLWPTVCNYHFLLKCVWNSTLNPESYATLRKISKWLAAKSWTIHSLQWTCSFMFIYRPCQVPWATSEVPQLRTAGMKLPQIWPGVTCYQTMNYQIETSHRPRLGVFLEQN